MGMNYPPVLRRRGSLEIILALTKMGSARFNDLMKVVPVSRSTLSTRLYELKEAGFIDKYDNNYELTDRAKAIIPTVRSIYRELWPIIGSLYFRLQKLSMLHRGELLINALFSLFGKESHMTRALSLGNIPWIFINKKEINRLYIIHGKIFYREELEKNVEARSEIAMMSDAIGVNELITWLSSYPLDIKCLWWNTFIGKALFHHLILIGLNKVNPIVYELCNKDPRKGGLHVRITKNSIITPSFKEYIGPEYGVIDLIKNPYTDKDKYILVIGGISGITTSAICFSLRNLVNDPRLENATTCVVKCTNKVDDFKIYREVEIIDAFRYQVS
jgi:predicted transcriptional regulator